jgi:hypothetical protein
MSLLRSLLDTHSSDFPDIVQPSVDLVGAGATTTAALAANAVYLYRFRVADPIVVANAEVYNGATVAGNLALGIYTEIGGTWTLVASTPDTAASGANAAQVIALSAPYRLIPGKDYYGALGATNNTYTILRGASSPSVALAAQKNQTLVKSGVYSSGLPATITTPAANTLIFWLAFTT